MILLDSYALVALLANERAADEVEEILGGEMRAVIASINLVEAVDVLSRVKGVPVDEAEEAVSLLLDSSLETMELGEAVAWRAARLRSKYYRRRRREVSVADCCLLASADEGDAIATNDPAVIQVAQAEGISVVQLPGPD